MMASVFLETKRLLLRQHEPADIEAYCAMEMDAEVRRYVGGSPRRREDAGKRFRENLKRIDDGSGMWATILKDTNQYIGRCGIYPHFDPQGRPIEGEASLGLYIASMYWNRGYATEAGLALIQMGFETLKLDRIVTLIQKGNDASIAVIDKLGFTLKRTEPGQTRTFYYFVRERVGRPGTE